MQTVLIVDDSRAMRKILTKIMAKLGFEAIEAGDGAEGLCQFETNSDIIDVSLIDWNMPEMNGLEMVKAIRANEAYSNHKLMMVTTEGEPAKMAQALMAGVDEFVMKPFTEDIIVEKLKLIGVEFEMHPTA